MAEGFGVVASAIQLADIGARTAVSISRLASHLRQRATFFDHQKNTRYASDATNATKFSPREMFDRIPPADERAGGCFRSNDPQDIRSPAGQSYQSCPGRQEEDGTGRNCRPNRKAI